MHIFQFAMVNFDDYYNSGIWGLFSPNPIRQTDYFFSGHLGHFYCKYNGRRRVKYTQDVEEIKGSEYRDQEVGS